MKKWISCLTAISLVFWLFPSSARGDTVTFFSGLQASGTFACGPGGTATSPCELNGYNKVSVQFTCASVPCVDEIQVQQRNSSNDNWATVLDLFNTGANDQGYVNTGYGQLQVVVIYTSGSLNGSLVRNLQ